MGRRRLAQLFILAALLLTLVIWLGPTFLARRAAHQLTVALGTPVRIGWLSWNPVAGRWRLGRVRIAAVTGPPALAAREITAQLGLGDVLRGQARLRSVLVDGLRLRLQATPGGWRLPIPESSGAAGAWPVLQVDWAGAPRARIRLEPAPDVRSSLRLRQLELEGRIEPDAVQATLWTRGRLDRGSLAFAGKIRTRDARRRIRLRIAAEALDVQRVLRLTAAPVADLRGAVSLRAKYEEAGDRQHVRRTISGGGDGRDVALLSHGVNAFWARAISVPRFALDLEQQRATFGAVRLDTLQAWLRRRDGRLELPALQAGPAAEGPAWTVAVARTDVTGGAVHVVDAATGDTVIAAKIAEAGSGLIGEAAAPVPVTLHVTLSTGGTIQARGEVVRAPLSARGRAELDEVTLPPLAAMAGLVPVLESGTARAALDVTLRDSGAVEASGTAEVVDVKTISPDPARLEQVMAFKTLRLAIERVRSDPPSAALSDVALEWPYVLLDRTPEGIFPLSLAARAGEDGDAGPLPEVRIKRLTVLGGRVDFQDATVTPSYWRSLASLGLRADRIRFAPLAVDALHGNTLVDELAPFKFEGRIGDETHLVADYERLALPPFNAYLAGAAPYIVASGLVSGHTEVRLERSELDVNNRVVLSRLGLRRAAGEDYITREVGVPLTLALALMKDYRGNIELTLPFGGDVRAPTFSFGDVMRQAVVRAIRGAILSPLNALGRVVLRDGRITEFDLDPIPFAPGARTLDATGQERAQQIARVLEVHTDLRLRLLPQVAATDADGVADDALRAAVASDPSARRLVAYLDARLAGAPSPPLEEEDVARLEALRATLPPQREALRKLAVDRGAAAVAVFVLDHRIDPKRVSTTSPAADAELPLAPAPGVAVELGET